MICDMDGSQFATQSFLIGIGGSKIQTEYCVLAITRPRDTNSNVFLPCAYFDNGKEQLGIRRYILCGGNRSRSLSAIDDGYTFHFDTTTVPISPRRGLNPLRNGGQSVVKIEEFLRGFIDSSGNSFVDLAGTE